MPTESGFQAATRRTALQPLVDLDAALDLILRLALGPGQLDAVDAAVADVDEVHVVDEPAEEAGAAGRIGPDAVALQREELLVGERGRRIGDESAERERGRQRERLQSEAEGHWELLLHIVFHGTELARRRAENPLAHDRRAAEEALLKRQPGRQARR